MFGTSEERQRWVVARSCIIQTSSGDLISLKKSQVIISINLLFLPTEDSYLSGMAMAIIIYLKKMINMYGTFLCQLLNGNIAQDLKHFLLNKILHLFFFTHSWNLQYIIIQSNKQLLHYFSTLQTST